MTRVLVVGAGGFVGGHIAEGFAADPRFTVTSVTRGRADGPSSAPGAQADLADAAQVAAVLRRWPADVVVHAAGRTSGTEEDIVRDNHTAGLTLLTAVERECPQAQLIVLGTAAEYGRSVDDRPIREDQPCAPRSEYGRAKLAVTEAAIARTRAGAVRAVVLRPFNVIGPGVSAQLPLGAFLDRVARAGPHSKPTVLMGPIDALRDFLAVDEVVRAVLRAVERAVTGEIINVASGKGRTLRDLIMHMLAVVGAEVDVVLDPAIPAIETAPIVGDPGKCRALLGFIPSADLDAALIAAWMQAMAKVAKGGA